MAYEYAGFKYEMRINSQGRAILATPLPGQHRNAFKEKHRMAATESYNDELTMKERSNARGPR